MNEDTGVVIVGGGITGLALAHELRRRGPAHVVLESDARAGGVIRSDFVDGHLLERGPQRTRLTAGIRALISELALEGEIITAPAGLPLYVYRHGKLRQVPFNAADFLRSSIVPFSGKLRLLAEPLTAPARTDETVAEYFTRKVGRDLYEAVLGPLYGGLYASDPAEMIVGLSLGHVLKEFGIRRSLLLPLLRRGGKIDPPAACSFRLGLGTLPQALFEANRENVRLSTNVTSISRRGGWEVEAGGVTYRAIDVYVSLLAKFLEYILEVVATAVLIAIR